MGFFENIQLAFSSLKSNKLRSLLTMLGIIIGIAAVIAIDTIGGSMTGTMTDSMSGMGANNITVMLTQKTTESQADGGPRLRLFMDKEPSAGDLITDEMIDEFLATFPDKVDHLELSVEAGYAGCPKYGSPNTTIVAVVRGVNRAVLEAGEKDSPLLAGRWLDDTRDAGRAVCVVADKFVQQVLGCTNEEALGRSVDLLLNKRVCTVYIEGVYQYNSGNSMYGNVKDDEIQTKLYLPLDVARRFSGAAPGYQSVTVVSAAGVDPNTFMKTTGSFFSTFYKRNNTWTVEASTLSSLLEGFTSMMRAVSLGISAIAAISLVVGGIGVMNIMTVSVTERTREIGTRKALGAPSSAIRRQFITESIVLCIVGGAIGVVVGVAMGAGLARVMGYAAHPSAKAIVVAVGFSMLIGVFFGFYPANKAAKMDPIEALRYE